MDEYKTHYNLSGYLINYEERPYEVRKAFTITEQSLQRYNCSTCFSVVDNNGSL